MLKLIQRIKAELRQIKISCHKKDVNPIFNKKLMKQIMKKTPAVDLRITCLGSGANNQRQNSVIIKANSRRYMINCPEAVSTTCQSDKSIGFSHIEDIFITHKSWNNIGGLLGCCLNLNAGGKELINLHGPPIVADVIKLMGVFADTKSCNTKLSDLYRGEDEFIEDGAFTISNFQLSPSGSKKAHPNIASFGYIFQVKPRPRKFDKEKLAAANLPASVKNSPLMGLLQLGTAVHSPDGTLIDPDTLLSDYKDEPMSLCVLECPTEEYLDSLRTCEKLIALMKERDPESNGGVCKLIVHLGPPGILKSPEYREFFEAHCVSNTLHIVFDGKDEEPYTDASFRSQAVLNMLDSNVFPLLYDQKRFDRPSTITEEEALKYTIAEKALQGSDPFRVVSEQVDQPEKEKTVEPAKTSFISAEQLLMYRLREANPAYIGISHAIQSVMSIQESILRSKFNGLIVPEQFDHTMSEFKRSMAESGFKPAPENEYPQVVFLGTGSSVPNQHRNVSAILLRTEEDRSILLDCGEGTVLQLIKLYGEEETHRIICNTRAILITHMHADHQTGVFGFLEERSRAWQRLRPDKPMSPLLLLVPYGFKRWFDFYESSIMPSADVSENLKMIFIQDLLGPNDEFDSRTHGNQQFEDLMSGMGLTRLLPICVPHTAASFAFRIDLELADGPWSVVYSGDTLPSENLVQKGQGCDLLIHEATFSDDQETTANLKKHSTSKQALAAAAAMDAKYCILTHFSQRYGRSPLNPPGGDHFSKLAGVGLAQDFMVVRRGDLPRLCYFSKPLDLLFVKHLQTVRKRMDMKKKVREKKGGEEESSGTPQEKYAKKEYAVQAAGQ